MQRVDDSDLGQLLYANGGKGWKKMTTDANEFSSTSHGSPEIGSSVTFRFNGTSVQVYGTIHSGTPKSPSFAIFILDSTQELTFSGNPSNDIQYTQTFYSSGLLPAAEHTLTMTLVDSESKLWIDHVDFFPATIGPLPTSSSTDNVATTNTAITSTQSQSQRLNSVSRGLIAGISVLGVVLVSLCLLGLVLWYRRRKRKIISDSSSDDPSFLPYINDISQHQIEPSPTSAVPRQYPHFDSMSSSRHPSQVPVQSGFIPRRKEPLPYFSTRNGH